MAVYIIPVFLFSFVFFGAGLRADENAGKPQEPPAAYLLGAEDQVHIHVLDMEDIPDKPVRIDPGGNLDLPLIGTLHAAGLTVSELRLEITTRLKRYVRNPMVNVTVTEFHSKPVTVLGAVNNPGMRQVEGPRTVLEIISMAGGLRSDAGSTITITRTKESGPLPIKDARIVLDGGYSVAQLNVDQLVNAKNPEENIQVLPSDVITVSTAEVVYVYGDVRKPGGFTLHSHESISALQALALAEGPQKTASTKHARISRVQGEGKSRTTIAMDLSAIIDGKKPDVPLQANDILVIPNNATRNMGLRALETAIQLGTGVLIFHR